MPRAQCEHPDTTHTVGETDGDRLRRDPTHGRSEHKDVRHSGDDDDAAVAVAVGGGDAGFPRAPAREGVH